MRRPRPREGGVLSTEALLQGLEVLDLAGEPAALAGRILADLGARVVKAEPPGGDPLRRVPPLGPDGTSLRFVAWSAGKELLELEGPGDPVLDALLARSDVVIDTPRWPGSVVIDPARAPHAVWVSVTPFGLEGPRSEWSATDLGIMASTGNMYCTGDPDRPPLRCAEPVSYAHSGPEAAMAALSALASGRPQRVDLSMQESVMIASMGWPGRYARTANRGRRLGANIGATREIWPCKDGFVSFGLRGGKARVANLETITRLVEEAGLATPALSERDWASFDHTSTSPEELDAISRPVAAFFATRTMAELYEAACATNLMLAPINSPAELLASKQLAERGFFRPAEGVERFPASFLQVKHPDGQIERPGPAGNATTERSARSGRYQQEHSSPVAGHGSGAWEGTRLVELGSGAAGPIALRYFAENGATVVRIESRARPDFLRTYGLRPGSPCGLDGSDMFDSLNVGKLGITLNLKSAEGKEIARRLVAWSDGVAENFAPRALRGLGLDYDSLLEVKPDLVMVSSCLQGQTGPHRDYPGFGGQGSALAGYNYLTGWPDREPVGPYGTITDSLAPRFVATALAAGLLYRRRTGLGLHLDVSQVEAATYTLAPWVLDFEVNGRAGGRCGNRSERFAPHGAFPCQGDDRFVAIACHDDEAWDRLAGLLGPGARNASLRTLEGRLLEVERVEALVGEWTITRDAAEVAAELQALGIEAVPVADFADASLDPQLAARGHFVTLDHPCMGACGYERNGFRLSDAKAGYDRPSPLLGEHEELVLGEILGIGEAERKRLAEAGVLA